MEIGGMGKGRCGSIWEVVSAGSVLSFWRVMATNVSMKLIPKKSFLTNIWPSLGEGTGKSVLYVNTSGPPLDSMITPFIVFGMDAMVRTG